MIIGDNFRVLEPLGQGGMGLVYLAEDLSLERKVAIKFLQSDGVGASQMDAVLGEARIIAKLNHPNIVPIYCVGMHVDRPFIVMEAVQGRSLRRFLNERGPLSPQKAASLAVSVCAALQACHDLNIAHLDLKPENLMVDESETIKVLDFGIARTLRGGEGEAPASYAGTPGYSSPEMNLKNPVDGRADIYALGVVLYEMVTGEGPFTGEDPVAIFSKQLLGTFKSLRIAFPELPISHDFANIVDRCLAVDPQDRYPSAEDLGTALDEFLKAPWFAEDEQTLVSEPLGFVADAPPTAFSLIPAAESSIMGMPLPLNAEVLQRTPMGVQVHSTHTSDEITAFYTHYLNAWGPTVMGTAVRFQAPEARLQMVAITPAADGCNFFLAFASQAPHQQTVEDVFGVPLPEDVEEILRTADQAVYLTPLNPQRAMGFYRQRLGAAPGITMIANDELSQLYIYPADASLYRFKSIVVMEAPEGESTRFRKKSRIVITAV